MDLIRTDTVFGKRANIVGNISADLVLESLGKIYIKSRNSARTLEEVIKTIITTNTEDAAAKTIIVDGLENLQVEPKEGQLIYDKLSNILYIWLDGKAIELINVAPEGTGYVKRSGDTMTGRLSINVPNGPPLAVNSTELVENLNAEYLDGEPKTAFAQKRKDELISGRWTFRNITRFQSNTKFDGDIVIDGSMGTPYFASGFAGYGWRMDADTNTLTVDNLVVRKLLMVYELVVNRVSAVNGSLWVTNAGKVVSSSLLPTHNYDLIFKNGTNQSLSDFVRTLGDDAYFIYYPQVEYKYVTPEERMTSSGVISQDTIKTLNTATRSRALVIKVKDLTTFTQEVDQNINNIDAYFNSDSEVFKVYKLFSDSFYFDVVFPIVTDKNYWCFSVSEDWRKKQEINNNSTSPDSFDYLGQAKSEVNQKYPNYWTSNTWLNAFDMVTNVRSYYKYFSTGQYYIVTFDDDSLPVFKEGDILRCQKWTHGGVKYYDALICNYINDSTYFIQVADSIFDKSTTIHYDDNLNPTVVESYETNINTTLYKQTKQYVPPKQDQEMLDSEGVFRVVTTEEQWKKLLLGGITKDDNLVQFGNLWNWQRQNAVYITAVDENAPYMEVVSNVNRPDYSVLYKVPVYRVQKLYQGATLQEIGINNDPIPYTGEYYEQSDSTKAQYAYGKVQNGLVFFDLSKHTVPASVQDVVYLSGVPNDKCIFDSGESPYMLLLEDYSQFILEDGYGTIRMEKGLSYAVIRTHRTVKVRLGHLDGIYDERFEINKQPYGYGLYADNVFLTGEFILNNGKTVFEITQEGLAFAVASKYAGDNARELLRNDMKAADARLAEVDRLMQEAHNQLRLEHNQLEIDHNTLKYDHDTLKEMHNELVQRVTVTEGDLKDFHESVYTINDLKTAGFMVTNKGESPGMIIWANYLYIATKQNELDGTEQPTALLSEGRIKSRFLEVQDVHSEYYLGNGHTIYYYNQSEVYNREGVWYFMDGREATRDGTKVYTMRDDYGWHLKYRGDGYLAFGNISWTRDGNLSLRGNVSVSGDQGIYVDPEDDLGVSIVPDSRNSAPHFVSYRRPRVFKCVGQVAAESGQIMARVPCSIPQGYSIEVSTNSFDIRIDLLNGDTVQMQDVSLRSSFTTTSYISSFNVIATMTREYSDVSVYIDIHGQGTQIGSDYLYVSGDSNHTLWLGRDCFSVLCTGGGFDAETYDKAYTNIGTNNVQVKQTHGIEIDHTGIYIIKKMGRTNFSGAYDSNYNIFDYRKSIFDWFVTRDEWEEGSSSTPVSTVGKIHYIIPSIGSDLGSTSSIVVNNTVNLSNLTGVNDGELVLIKGNPNEITVTTTGNYIINNTGSEITNSIGPDKRSRLFFKIPQSNFWIEMACYNN